MTTRYMPDLPDSHKGVGKPENPSEVARETAPPEPREGEAEANAGEMPQHIEAAVAERPRRSPRMAKAHALFDELWEEWAERAQEVASDCFGYHCAHADSELECIFLAALMFMRPPFVQFGYGGPLDLGQRMEVRPQYSCGPYRIDFAVIVAPAGEYGEEIRIAVECDGQYFHDRTDKQAARDKRRDRFLTLNGWRPVRFVESEIMKDPTGCADQVAELITELIEKQYERARLIRGDGGTA